MSVHEEEGSDLWKTVICGVGCRSNNLRDAGCGGGAQPRTTFHFSEVKEHGMNNEAPTGILPWPENGNGYLRKSTPVQWKVLEKRDERTVRIGKWLGWCPGGGPQQRNYRAAASGRADVCWLGSG